MHVFCWSILSGNQTFLGRISPLRCLTLHVSGSHNYHNPTGLNVGLGCNAHFKPSTCPWISGLLKRENRSRCAAFLGAACLLSASCCSAHQTTFTRAKLSLLPSICRIHKADYALYDLWSFHIWIYTDATDLTYLWKINTPKKRGIPSYVPSTEIVIGLL